MDIRGSLDECLCAEDRGLVTINTYRVEGVVCVYIVDDVDIALVYPKNFAMQSAYCHNLAVFGGARPRLRQAIETAISTVWFLVGTGGMGYGDYYWGLYRDYCSLY